MWERSFGKECWRRVLEERIVEKCCREVLEKIVGEECCRNRLHSQLGGRDIFCLLHLPADTDGLHHAGSWQNVCLDLQGAWAWCGVLDEFTTGPSL